VKFFMGIVRNVFEALCETAYVCNGRDHSENLGVVGRIILEWILGK
jgi:hypothetical protein